MRNMRLAGIRLAAALMLLAGIGFTAHAAHATTLTATVISLHVNSTADADDPTPTDTTCDTTLSGSPCTLRAAVDTANGIAPPANQYYIVKIYVPVGTYKLTNPLGELDLTGAGGGAQANQIHIIGSSATVDAGGSPENNINACDCRVFNVTNNSEIFGLTIKGGFADHGAGILDDGALSLSYDTISGNTALPAAICSNTSAPRCSQDGGAGIYVGDNNSNGQRALLTAFTTNIINNATTMTCANAYCYGGGGGLSIWHGTVSLKSSTVNYNASCANATVTAGAKQPAITDTGCAGGEGGGIWNWGYLSINSSYLECNVAGATVSYCASVGFGYSGAEGGAIYNDGNLQMVVTQVISNYASGEGGGLWNDQRADILGSNFTSNTAGHFNTDTGGGGAIFTCVECSQAEYSVGAVSFSQGSINSNHAGEAGGAVYIAGGSFSAFTTTVGFNYAGRLGGAFADLGSLYLSTDQVGHNSAGDSGTGVLSTGGTGSGFDGAGGAIYSFFGTSFHANNTNISNNVAQTSGTVGSGTCDSAGGGIWATTIISSSIANIVLAAANVSGNIACNGGGIYDSYAPLVLHSSHMIFNQAKNKGGGVYLNGSTPPSALMVVDSSSISNNHAGVQYGGLYDTDPTSFLIANTGSISGNTAPLTCPNTAVPCS